jgi:hypothetical protein
MGGPLLIFAGLSFDCFLAAFRKVLDCVIKEEEFDDIED